MAANALTEATHCISLDDVKTASGRIQGIAHLTQVLTCKAIDNMAAEVSRQVDGGNSGITQGRHFFFKNEAMQRTGSFKFRGALNATLTAKESLQLSTGEAEQVFDVVTHSSGNHAQALALAALVASDDEKKNGNRIKVKATIVMPRGAPVIKQRAVHGYGAKVVLVENTNEAREEEAERIRQETGAIFIHPSENPRVIAGQGTAGLEMIQQTNEMIQSGNEQYRGSGHLDAVIIPVGGGGLASGNTIAFRGILGDTVKVSNYFEIELSLVVGFTLILAFRF
jgi:threonine dehydratase